MRLEPKLTAPPKGPDTLPFYEAAARGEFLLRHCTECLRFHWYPRPRCPFCMAATEWVPASGRGTIVSYSVMRRVKVPFAIAYVALNEGPSMMTNLVDCDSERLAIGSDVVLVFKPAEDGTPIPCFTLP